MSGSQASPNPSPAILNVFIKIIQTNKQTVRVELIRICNSRAVVASILNAVEVAINVGVASVTD